jgi:hypothetical protein
MVPGFTMKRFAGLLIAAGITLSPANLSAAPGAAKSKYLETTAGSFELDFEARTVTYLVSLEISPKLPRPAYARVEFENPANRDAPDIKVVRIERDQSSIDLRSEAFPNARNRKTYSVLVTLYADESLETKLGTHRQKIELRVPSEALAMARAPTSSEINTVADAQVKADALRTIGVFELAEGGSATPVLVSTNGLGMEGSSFLERWIIESNGKSVPYRVKLTPSPAGGVDIEVARIVE